MRHHLFVRRRYDAQRRGGPNDALDGFAFVLLRAVPFLRKRQRRLAAGHRQEDFRQDFGVEQRAVQRTLAVVDLIARAERIQTVALAREHLARHRQAVGDATEGFGFRNAAVQHGKLIVHKADIKRGVMDHQLGAADVVEEFVRDLGEGRLIGEKLIRNAVHAERFRIHQPIGTQIDMEVVAGQATVHHLYRTNFNDAVTFVMHTDHVHAGGFSIEYDLAVICSAHRIRFMSDLAFFSEGSLPEMRKQVEIFTDGSCLGNPGPGGYGAILRYGQHEKLFSAGYRLTTNNRMELMAAIVALEALKEPCHVVLSTDSQYVRQGITSWIHNWKKRGWKTADKKPVKNVDLWKRLDSALAGHEIQWEWVKGHAGHPENERCDELARSAASHPQSEDIGYKVES